MYIYIYICIRRCMQLMKEFSESMQHTNKRERMFCVLSFRVLARFLLFSFDCRKINLTFFSHAKIVVIALSLLSLWIMHSRVKLLSNGSEEMAFDIYIYRKIIYSLGGRCRLALISNCVNVFLFFFIEIFHRFMSSEQLNTHLKSLRGFCFRPVGTKHKHKFRHVDKIDGKCSGKKNHSYRIKCTKWKTFHLKTKSGNNLCGNERRMGRTRSSVNWATCRRWAEARTR